MIESQVSRPYDRWHVHPDHLSGMYAIAYATRNNLKIASEHYFLIERGIQRLVDIGIASGKLKLRQWPGRFVLPPSTPISENTLIDIQDFCDAAKDLGYDCPTDARELALLFNLPTETHPSASGAQKNQGTPPKLSPEQRAEVVKLYDRGRGISVNSLAQQFKVSRPTIDKVLRKADIKKNVVSGCKPPSHQNPHEIRISQIAGGCMLTATGGLHE